MSRYDPDLSHPDDESERYSLDEAWRFNEDMQPEASGEPLPPGEWWMFYDSQIGRWCIYDDGPPRPDGQGPV